MDERLDFEADDATAAIQRYTSFLNTLKRDSYTATQRLHKFEYGLTVAQNLLQDIKEIQQVDHKT